MRRYKLGFSNICALSLTILVSACVGEKADGGASEATSESVTDSESAGSKPTDAIDSESDSEASEPIDSESDGEPTESYDSESDGETDLSADPPPAAGCECDAPDPCSVPLCERVEWIDDDGDGELDADAVDAFMVSSACALAALRDGAAGRVDWRDASNGGQFDEKGAHALFGDGTARRTHDGVIDLCFYASEEVSVGPLKPAQVFIDCLAEADPQARFDCVRNPESGGSSSCQDGELDCGGV